jgi:hypothetical protein
MPRKPHDDTRSGPAIEPDDDAPDNGKAAQQQVLRSRAGAAPMPVAPGTPRSVFDSVPPAKPDAVAPVIHRQRPIPEPRVGRQSNYLAVYEGLQVGDCAEFPKRSS